MGTKARKLVRTGCFEADTSIRQAFAVNMLSLLQRQWYRQRYESEVSSLPDVHRADMEADSRPSLEGSAASLGDFTVSYDISDTNALLLYGAEGFSPEYTQKVFVWAHQAALRNMPVIEDRWQYLERMTDVYSGLLNPESGVSEFTECVVDLLIEYALFGEVDKIAERFPFSDKASGLVR